MYFREMFNSSFLERSTKFGVPVQYDTHLVNSKYHEEDDVIVDREIPRFPNDGPGDK